MSKIKINMNLKYFFVILMIVQYAHSAVHVQEMCLNCAEDGWEEIPCYLLYSNYYKRSIRGKEFQKNEQSNLTSKTVPLRLKSTFLTTSTTATTPTPIQITSTLSPISKEARNRFENHMPEKYYKQCSTFIPNNCGIRHFLNNFKTTQIKPLKAQKWRAKKNTDHQSMLIKDSAQNTIEKNGPSKALSLTVSSPPQKRKVSNYNEYQESLDSIEEITKLLKLNIIGPPELYFPVGDPSYDIYTEHVLKANSPTSFFEIFDKSLQAPSNTYLFPSDGQFLMKDVKFDKFEKKQNDDSTQLYKTDKMESKYAYSDPNVNKNRLVLSVNKPLKYFAWNADLNHFLHKNT